MVTIRHSENKRDALHLSRRGAIRLTKALNKHECTMAWGWTYRPLRSGFWRYVVVAYDKRSNVFGYFAEATLI